MLTALLGASKGIGYYVLLDLLSDEGNEAILLLRNPNCFDDDDIVNPAIKAGRVRIVKGDATMQTDVEKLFQNKVDTVITSVGGTPKFTLGGFKLTDPTVCTRATLALVNVLAEIKVRQPIPRVIVVSSMGMGSEHHVMPAALRLLYPWMLSGPHADKEGLEYLLQRAAVGLPTPTKKEDIPAKTILSEEVRTAAPESIIPEITIVRPALLTDGDARGPSALKAKEGLTTYTCSRKDVAEFIATQCLPPKTEWVNKCPILGY